MRRIPYFLPDDNRQASGQSVEREEGGESGEEQPVKEAAPGIPIVRSNTPKPLSLGSIAPGGGQSHWARYEEQIPPSAFPVQAPSAPPLPEEFSEQEGVPIGETSTPLPVRPLLPAREQEFLWLFEYGLEMDPALLNSPERLDGLALLYGLALLKGYKVVVGALKAPGPGSGQQTIVTILPAYEGESEVWGVLYRVPRRVAERVGDEQPLLDTIHAATQVQGLFKPIRVVVRETYRDHDVSGVVTYIASESLIQRMRDVPEHMVTHMMIERLVAIGRKQKLPENYLRELGMSATTQEDVPVAPSKAVNAPPLAEYRTEPLSMLVGERHAENGPAHQEAPEHVASTRVPARWLVAFASYLVCMLLIVLTLAVLEGAGIADGLLTSSFTPLHVPWLVLIYGLLGGCVSCIATLGRCQTFTPPHFVLITWFARPYVGAVLALFAYLLLNCGMFTLSDKTEVRNTLFMLIGALAGLCESLLFMRKRT